MADGIAIWSRKPLRQKRILLDMVEAAYESRLQFYLQGYIEYKIETLLRYNPYSFTLTKDAPENRPMIFHICPFEEQQFGIGRWIDTRFFNKKGEKIIEHELYRLAVSEDLDNEMTFHFSFHYLKINKDQFITMADYIIDWELIKEAYPKGFKEDWY